MATQLDACKAAAEKYESQLRSAATKDEALTLAIGVAENLMKAMTLSSDLNEKKQLKAQCGKIMDVAARIKDDANWTPLAERLQTTTKTAQIGQWATEVVSAQLSAGFEDSASQSTLSRHAFSSTTAPLHSAAFCSKTPPRGAPALLIDLSDDLFPSSKLTPSASTNARYEDNADPTSQTSAAEKALPTATDAQLALSPSSTRRHGQSIAEKGATSAAPATASYSQVHRLADPVSSRKRSKREDIILLKASMINGFKCPPWDKNPSPAEFAAQESAGLFFDTHDLSLSPYQQQFFHGWIRATDAIPPPSTFGDSRKGIGPLMSSSRTIDLVQDAATDCSVVTSLCAAIARAERGHEQMLTNKIYPFDKHLGRPVTSTNGKYIVRLNFNGCWRRVVIDDRLPVSSTHRLLHVVDRRNQALLWPALLEKAYLKVRGGYDFPGSNSCSDLWTFTGWIPEQAFLQEADTVPGQLWNRIYNAFLYGDVLVTAGTGRMSSRQERELGLEGQHSYVVLDMKETDHDRLLLVKNPWVEGRGWRGPRPSAAMALDASTATGSSNNSLESYHHDSVPTLDRPHPTTFWIGLEQVIQHFESLYLNWNPGLFKCRQDIHFEWTVDAQQSRGGCISKHPQFAISTKGAGPVWLLLSRHFRDAPTDTKDESDTFNDGSIQPKSQIDSSGEHSKGFMSICICNGHGERLYIKEAFFESSDYVTTPQCLLRWDIEANTAYTIVIDQDELPPSLYTFSLSAFSNSSITLEPATQRYPLQKMEEGAWTRQTAGGSTSSPRYFENPQYSLEIRERGPLAILLTSNHEHPMHVKLALGYGKRIYKLQSRDVLADSGDHRIGCVFTEIKDLQPGLYTIICSLFEAGQTGDYTLGVDSTSNVVVKQIPRDGAGLLSTKLSPACFAAHVHKVAAPILPHRLASYTIVARFLKATSPRSSDLGSLSRSPLRFSVELGRGPERKFVIASERGEYTDAATVRSEKVNIDPTIISQGDMYLVLDRLSGPGGPVEEWYEVEIFTDAPKACSVGVWREWDD
ncbi:calpain-like protease palB/rim-13 [Setomelanomma holmii]|uniref:Calpain-like protease palB/rim-13 n=1 Tax=Setomelanomma holmii TaxID=210430 RepID=A0A9P4HFN6_9PLEO|nr:calpain-like protease palB/rim-13 [Setomelanomma holmii]